MDLSSLMECDTISSETRASISTMTIKEKKKYVATVHPFKITYFNPRNYYYTKVRTNDGKKKNITATTENGLIEKLYNFYAGISGSTVLKDLLKDMLLYNQGICSDKSLAEYNRLWKSYYSNSSLAKKKIASITYEMWVDFLDETVRTKRLTKKQAKQMMIVANKIIAYCIRKQILTMNPIRDIMKNDFPYRKEPSYTVIKAKPFTHAQQEKIVEWCHLQLKKVRTEKVYPLAILFNLRAGLRIGELTGLTWDDVDFEQNCIYIRKQRVLDCKMEDNLHFSYSGTIFTDHLKAYENARVLPISEKTMQILKTVKEYHFDETIVFPLRYHTYNDKVKAAAIYAGITDLKQIRTHSLRTTAASNLYEVLKDKESCKAFMGHTDSSMTEKYLKGVDTYNSLVGLI